LCDPHTPWLDKCLKYLDQSSSNNTALAKTHWWRMVLRLPEWHIHHCRSHNCCTVKWNYCNMRNTLVCRFWCWFWNQHGRCQSNGMAVAIVNSTTCPHMGCHRILLPPSTAAAAFTAVFIGTTSWSGKCSYSTSLARIIKERWVNRPF